MNGFVVTYLGEMDDIACGLFATYEEASKLAAEIGATMDTLGDDHHPAVARVLDLMNRDVGTYCGVAVVTFVGGMVTAWELVVDGDEAE
jgi:hypothetical protein